MGVVDHLGAEADPQQGIVEAPVLLHRHQGEMVHEGPGEELGATDRAHAGEVLKAKNREIEELAEQVQQDEVKRIAELNVERDRQLKSPVHSPHVHADPESDRRLKSLGELFVDSTAFKSYRDTKPSSLTSPAR